MAGWPAPPSSAPVLSDVDDPLAGHPRYEKIRWANPDKPNVQVALDRVASRNVAVKFIERGAKVTKHVKREILHHHSLVHRNVVRFYDAFLTPTYLVIVQELGEMNLWQHVCNRGGRLAEEEARGFFRQMIEGLEYCHSMGVANRDIKLENSILKTQYAGGVSTPVLKLCDFGYAKGDSDSNAISLVGTSSYVAPEVVDPSKRDPNPNAGQRIYNAKMADIWSAGVALYVMIEGRFPCGTEKSNGCMEALLKRIAAMKLDPPRLMSPGAVELVMGIFKASAERDTIAKIKERAWFKDGMGSAPASEPELPAEEGVPSVAELEAVIKKAEIAELGTNLSIDELMDSVEME
ncbi:unnamed protein product [Ostreobium quekettii]|uniref:Protein kinase domain-containing protein n=1 Tax=Ostreobium quekettii TaxID=121088 RepID=A0A8S1J050_9CHLO|nr:unnamed protein product [Ostreobium quekettii]|eukprot:evm.model.scf_932.1 EVM.evm.TU.scf_932.1   scf_932:17040-19102(+)